LNVSIVSLRHTGPLAGRRAALASVWSGIVILSFRWSWAR
jgi:hypothetical protein